MSQTVSSHSGMRARLAIEMLAMRIGLDLKSEMMLAERWHLVQQGGDQSQDPVNRNYDARRHCARARPARGRIN